jgi:hypothetical protein
MPRELCLAVSVEELMDLGFDGRHALNLFIQKQETSRIEMTHGSVQWQEIYILSRAKLESVGTTSSNRTTLYQLQMRDEGTWSSHGMLMYKGGPTY